MRGPLIKKPEHRHSQPYKENTIFPSGIVIQDSTVQSSTTFQYPILLASQHNATSPTHSIKASHCFQAYYLMLASNMQHDLDHPPISDVAPIDVVFIVMCSPFLANFLSVGMTSSNTLNIVTIVGHTTIT